MPGVVTWAVPKEAVYMKENEGGQIAKIGVYDPSLPGTENKMRPCAEGFAGLGVPALERCARAEGEWVTIDEIGYLETKNAQYCSVLQSSYFKFPELAIGSIFS